MIMAEPLDDFIKEPIKTLWQIYVVRKADGTILFSATTLAFNVTEALSNLATANASKLTGLTHNKIDVYAREIGYPVSVETIKSALSK